MAWGRPMHTRTTVLVTGGAGFIGSNFLLHSVPRRPDLHFVNLDALTYAANPATLKDLEGCSNYEFHRVDIRNAAHVQAIFEKTEPDVVFHFAAESHVDRSIVSPGAFIETNVNGTFHLLDAAKRQSKRPVFQHVSTDEVYGSLGAEGHFTETTAYDPSSPYSASKAASDHLVRAYGRTFGLRIRITNCSNNYGPYQFPEKLIPLMIRNAVRGLPLPVYGAGLNVRDWLYVTDHVEALWAVYEKGRDGETYNVGGNSEAKNIDIVHRICDLVAARLGKPPAALRGLIQFVQDRPGHDLRYAIDASKLKRECRWEPKETLESGLEKTVAWYLENQDWVESITSGKYEDWIRENYGSRGGQS
jgi:dTDP-glucose 4,6-dehydratase